ncbi:hypothetical protein NYE76_25285 [Paenibacillus sp. FSL M7-0831]|uniref:hypothetical protein n=1 Tax=Paenibacillus macerans TaxID=44252 RepID=UPI002DB8E8D2|nr:hypothetical protein [Paenibacillus macerans]MEC0333080.1 hypothetical protein [Paenibacillus macerans]
MEGKVKNFLTPAQKRVPIPAFALEWHPVFHDMFYSGYAGLSRALSPPGSPA